MPEVSETRQRKFGKYVFVLVEEIRPDIDASGFSEYVHTLPPGAKPNKHASGPFCRFRLNRPPAGPGVYAITVADELQYVGECENMAARFGAAGYGQISLRNTHHDGQATNCKINARILESAKSSRTIEVWFYQSSQRKLVESELISELSPNWNGASGNRAPRYLLRISPPAPACVPDQKKSSTTATAEDFRNAILQLLAEASRHGNSDVRIRAGDLHRKVGAYPGPNHRMPVCCSVMRSLMMPGDSVIECPRKGNGASLTISYRLPRPQHRPS